MVLIVFVLISAVAAVTTLSLDQYALAGSIAAEALTAIRTVTALNVQPDTVRRYRHHLFKAMDVSNSSVLQYILCTMCSPLYCIWCLSCDLL